MVRKKDVKEEEMWKEWAGRGGGEGWRVDLWVQGSGVLRGGRGRRGRRELRGYQVWALGSWPTSPAFSIVNRRGPSLPWRSLNPLTGILEVPVVNCNNRDFFSASHVRIAYHKSHIHKGRCGKTSGGTRLGGETSWAVIDRVERDKGWALRKWLRGRGVDLPEPLHHIVTFCVSSIIGMFLPIVYIHFRNPADEEF